MNVNLNGKIFPSDQPIFNGQNRAFQYGDALFETIRMFDGNLPFLENHFQRLVKGLKFFKYKIPKKYTVKFFQKEIQKIASGNARIRITVFRTEGGLYTPKNFRPKFFIAVSPLSSNKYELNRKGLKIGIFEDIKLPCSPLSNLKTCNSLPYVLAGIFKKEQNLNDCLILNEKGRISEASSSNLFLLQKNKLITPSLSEGCIDGILRNQIRSIAVKENINLIEKPITLATLKRSEEIWLTNSISGIQWVEKIYDFPTLPQPSLAPNFIRKLNLF